MKPLQFKKNINVPIGASFGFIWNLSIIVPNDLLLVVVSVIYLNYNFVLSQT
jgi:hypothetical protein